jgi:excisionase family DNA binding protein
MPAFFVLTVAKVANFLNVSDRRVRTLLSQGRIQGYKDDKGAWRVFWPLMVRPGRRGPDLKCYPVRKITQGARLPGLSRKGAR